jgi:hypothetical protein
MILLQTRTFRAADKQNLEMDFVTMCCFAAYVFVPAQPQDTFLEALSAFVLGS